MPTALFPPVIITPHQSIRNVPCWGLHRALRRRGRATGLDGATALRRSPPARHVADRLVRAVLGVNAEELWRRPTQLHGLGAEALDEVRAGLVPCAPPPHRAAISALRPGRTSTRPARTSSSASAPRPCNQVREGASRLPAANGPAGIGPWAYLRLAGVDKPKIYIPSGCLHRTGSRVGHDRDVCPYVSHRPASRSC
jgi:hypothetical protein